MTRIVESGLIGKADRVLDFACGWGEDVQRLSKRFDIVGWDPHVGFNHTARPTGKFSVVTAIYLVNVLPRPADRAHALGDAWDFVADGGCLVVVSRTKAQIASEAGTKWPRHSDGYLSSVAKGTFQKGHDLEDLERLLKPLKGASIEAAPFSDSTFTCGIARRSGKGR
jgi:hypothetical protein